MVKEVKESSRLEWTPPPEDIALRERIRQYAREHDDRYSARLFDLWDAWNEEHFDALMTPALIFLDEPGQTKCYGMCSAYSGLAGCRSQIQLRPSILDGTLRDLRKGSKDPAGLRLFLEDVLLHEMVHQYHQEVTGENDASWSGHGPAFSAKANEIGRKLGLPEVGRTCKKRDRKPGEESPSQWPHDVRPDGHYFGAHVPSRPDKSKNVMVPLLNLDKAAEILRENFDVEELRKRL